MVLWCVQVFEKARELLPIGACIVSFTLCTPFSTEQVEQLAASVLP